MTPEQQRLFDMLQELVTLFKEHDLTYYVAGGTALGAIRHGGFIPWDDDIDLMMPRNDWARFVEIARSGGLPANRVLNCIELDEDYPHVFGRYTDITSCAVHYNQLLGGTAEGFIIDIFILDPVPNAHEAFQAHRKTLSLYNDLANEVGYSYPMSQDKALLKHYSRRVRQEGRRAVFQELDEELSRYKDQDCDYLVMRWAAAPRLFSKDIYSYTRYERFEGIDVSVPGKLSDYLVQHYGDDWAYLPSGVGRITHDAITFLDVDYKTLQDDYLPFLDRERSRKALLNRRAYHIRFMDELQRGERLKANICASFARMVTLARVEACGLQLQAELDDGHFSVLDWIFAEFYKWQTSPELAGREEYLTINRFYDPIYIDIGDDLLRLALLNLLDTNRVAKANRILLIREHVLGALPPQLLDVRRQIEAVRMPASLKDVGCLEESVEFSELVATQRPKNFSNTVFRLEQLSRDHDFQKLEREAKSAAAVFPAAGEFKKYLADCRYAKASSDEEKRETFNDYKDALQKTTLSSLTADVRSKAQRDPGCIDEELAELLDSVSDKAVQEITKPRLTYDAQKLGGKVCDLLAELADMCESEGIDYYLGPDATRLALVHGNNASGYLALDLLVPAEQLPQLIASIKAKEANDRALDYWETNKNHLSYQVDYVDTSTTFLQLDEGFNIAAHGVKVVITPIRAVVRGAKGDLLDILETGWEVNGYQLTKRVTGKRVVAAATARAAMVGGRKRLAKTLFSSFSSAYADSSSEAMVRFPGKEPFVFDAHLMADAQTVEFCGRPYPVMGDCKTLLDQFLGAGWEEAARNGQPHYKNALISAEIPYETLLDQLEQDGCSVNSLFSLMKRIRLGMLPMANDLRIRNRVMSIAARSEDRKRLYDDLEAHREEITRMLEAEDYDGLKALFREYDQLAKSYLRRGLGLCPSKEYLDVLCELWRHDGDAGKADKLAALAPEEHYRPLGG